MTYIPLTQLRLGNIAYGTGDEREREREREACYKPPVQHLSVSRCCASWSIRSWWASWVTEVREMMGGAGAGGGWRRMLRPPD